MQFTIGSITSATILALTLATSASAAALPVEIEARGGTAGQSCTAKQFYEVFSDCSNGQARYNVWIGVTYAGGRGCNDVKHALQDVTIDRRSTTVMEMGLRKGANGLGHYTCDADDAGNTVLGFDVCLGQGPKINDALASMYPMVNGFNCPSE